MLSQLSVTSRKGARHVGLAICYGQDVLSFVLLLPGEQPLHSCVTVLGGFIVPLLPGVQPLHSYVPLPVGFIVPLVPGEQPFHSYTLVTWLTAFT